MATVYQAPVKKKVIVLKKGSLYVNRVTKRVERLIELQGNLAWTSWHKEACLAFPKSNLKLADQKQVNDYLGLTVPQEDWKSSDINKNIEFCNFGGKMFMRIRKGPPICLGVS